MEPNTPDHVVRAFATLVQMFADRGTPCVDADGMSDEQLRRLAERSTIMAVELKLAAAEGDGPAAARIVFTLSAKTRVADIVRRMSADPRVLNVIVTRERIAPNSIKSIKDMTFEMFDLRELQYNVTHHELVPPHEVVRDEAEISRILAENNARSKLHLPLIAHTDPVARYLGVRPGQLVKITRPSPSAGEYVLYRTCI